jgi:hypothetical protein
MQMAALPKFARTKFSAAMVAKCASAYATIGGPFLDFAFNLPRQDSNRNAGRACVEPRPPPRRRLSITRSLYCHLTFWRACDARLPIFVVIVLVSCCRNCPLLAAFSTEKGGAQYRRPKTRGLLALRRPRACLDRA